VVANALVRICGGGVSGLDAVDVGSLEVGFQHTFGKFDSALPEFAKINDAAYWDYQRSKVYARTDKAIRRIFRKSRGKSKSKTVEQEVTIGDAPNICPRCQATRIGTHHSGSHSRLRPEFTRRGIKRWAVQVPLQGASMQGMPRIAAHLFFGDRGTFRTCRLLSSIF